jgi:hypothetical protein
MGLTVITSAAGHHRIARCRDWLKARAPAEEILIIGATLGAANELARSLAQEKRASFGATQLATDAETNGGVGVKIQFERILCWPDGHREIEGVTPKALPAPDGG